LKRDRVERPFSGRLTNRLDRNSLARLRAARRGRLPETPGTTNPAFVVSGTATYFDPVELITLPVRLLPKPIDNLGQARDRQSRRSIWCSAASECNFAL